MSNITEQSYARTAILSYLQKVVQKKDDLGGKPEKQMDLWGLNEPMVPSSCSYVIFNFIDVTVERSDMACVSKDGLCY